MLWEMFIIHVTILFFFAMESKKEVPSHHRAAGQTMDSPAPKSSFEPGIQVPPRKLRPVFFRFVSLLVCYLGRISSF